MLWKNYIQLGEDTVEYKHAFCQHDVVAASASRGYLPKLIRQTLISWVKRCSFEMSQHTFWVIVYHSVLSMVFWLLVMLDKEHSAGLYAPLMCATRTMWFMSAVKSMMKYDLIKVVTVLDAVHSLPSPWGPNPHANNDVSLPLSVRVFFKVITDNIQRRWRVRKSSINQTSLSVGPPRFCRSWWESTCARLRR